MKLKVWRVPCIGSSAMMGPYQPFVLRSTTPFHGLWQWLWHGWYCLAWWYVWQTWLQYRRACSYLYMFSSLLWVLTFMILHFNSQTEKAKMHHLSITNIYHSWAPSCSPCSRLEEWTSFPSYKKPGSFSPMNWGTISEVPGLQDTIEESPHDIPIEKKPGSTVQDGNDKSTLWRCGSWFIARYRMIHQDISSVVLMFCFSDLQWRLWAQNYAKLITLEDLWGKGRFKNHQDLKFHWPLALIPQKGLQMPRMRSTLVWKWSRKNWRQGGHFKNLRTTYLFIVWWIKWEGFHKELF